jgi:hypothetical protein
VLALLERHAPPEMASLRAAIPRGLSELQPGAPLIVVDVEVHDWVEDKFKPVWGSGQFGHYTPQKGSKLSYLRVVQLAWCVRREDGECVHRSFYVSGADRLITRYASDNHHITNAYVQREGVAIDQALRCFLHDCRWLRQVDGFLVAHHLEFDAGIICEELSRIPVLRSYRPLVAALATNGICTMTTAAKRIGVRTHYSGTSYLSQSLPRAFSHFVTWAQWNEDAHHDASYDVSKTLELYDAMFRVSQPL